MTITTRVLTKKSFENSTTTQEFTIRSNNGVIRIFSVTGTTTLSLKNAAGTYLTYGTVPAGEAREVVNCFEGDYRISGTDFNYQWAD